MKRTKGKNARRECYRLLGRIIGGDGIPQFLKTPQPALEDRTGAQLLQRLQELEKEMGALP